MTAPNPLNPHGRAVCMASGALIAGLAVAAGLSVPEVEFPLGSDWGHHFTVAAFFWHPDPEIGYPLFRRPFFGWLMGAMGEGMGYFTAAQLIGRLAAVVATLAAGLGAWALVGPFAGVAAAVAVLCMPLVIHGSTWVNHYPLLGAACGLALGAGAAVRRWPRLPWAMLAGLAAGAAFVIDVRGEVMLPAATALLLLGLPWRDRLRTLTLIAGFVGMAAVVMLHSQWLERAFDVPQLRFEEQIRVQRLGVLTQIQAGTFADPVLEQACAGVKPGPLEATAVNSDCANALRKNAWTRLSTAGDLPSAWTLGLLPLVLLPLGAGRGERLRSSAASALVFGVPLIGLFIGMGWVTYFPRYVLAFGAGLAMIAPVALGRLMHLLSRGHRWSGAVAGGLAFAWGLAIWPGATARSTVALAAPSGSDRAAGVLARWASTGIGDGDAIVDCAGLALDSLLLPDRINYLRFAPGDPQCDALVRDPIPAPGDVYLITMHRDLPDHATGLAFDLAAIQAAGWVPTPLDHIPDGYRVWRVQR